MNVATHVTSSNCLADSIGSPRSTNVQAASIVARNEIDHSKDVIGTGEKMVANAAKTPYTMSRRDAAILGRLSLLRRSKRKAAAGSTANGRTARIKSSNSPASFGEWMFQNPVFRLDHRHPHNIRADVGACQNREDRVEAGREVAI
jgi:hypothetical protein